MEIPVSAKKRVFHEIEGSSTFMSKAFAMPPINIVKNEKEKSNLNNSQPIQKKIKKKKSKIPPEVFAFRREIHNCCKNNDLQRAIEGYQRIRNQMFPTTGEDCNPELHEEKRQKIEDDPKKGLNSIEPQTFHNLIALCDGLSQRSIHIGTPNKNSHSQKEQETNKNKNGQDSEIEHIIPVSTEKRIEFANELQKDMAKLNISLKETTYTSLIRLYSKSKNTIAQAQSILETALSFTPSQSSSHTIIPKLRMFNSLIAAYTEANDLSSILRLWEKCQQLDIQLSEKEYAMIIRCATHVKDVDVMDKALTELAEEVLVPSCQTTEIIEAWFTESGIKVCINGSQKSLLSKVKLKPTMAPSIMEDLANSNSIPLAAKSSMQYEISSNCKIDTQTGTLQTGCLAKAQLQPIPLCSSSQSLLLNMNETIVISGKLKDHNSPYQGGKKGKKRLPEKELIEKRVNQWKEFKSFLADNAGPCSLSYNEDERTKVSSLSDTFIGSTTESKRKYDVVLDGANIGYFKTNFCGAPKHVDYRQIDWIIQHFNHLNLKVLLVLHERHFHPNLIPKFAESIAQSWKEGSPLLSLYQAPYGSNDDWFWFHAAIWCGEGTMVVTNDEMRDHFFQMLTHGMFLRWKERHQIHFSFGDWTEKDAKSNRKRRKVELVFPDAYSRRIQIVKVPCTEKTDERNSETGLVIPLPKQGDTNRFLDGVHVATDSEPEEETYVCIKPSKKKLDNVIN